LARIYTRTGDKGETGLAGGRRVPKDSLRVRAYGDVDELNSVIGVARSVLQDAVLNDLLGSLQENLFVAGADLAAPPNMRSNIPRITASMIKEIEKTIDKFEGELPPLKAFILPGGGQAGALLHFARTVARRAERRIVALSKAEEINDQLIPFINRLSDLLFVLARAVNRKEGQKEVEWHPKP